MTLKENLAKETTLGAWEGLLQRPIRLTEIIEHTRNPVGGVP